MKTIKMAALLGALAFAGPAAAQGTVPGQAMVPLGFCQIGSSTLGSATKLSACTGAWNAGAGGIPTGATMIAVQAESANIRYRDDGVAPTASVGQEIVSGQVPMLYTGTLSALQFIAVSGSPILDISFYRQ